MLETELHELIEQLQNQKCERQTIEVKSAQKGCPQKDLYETYSAFANQDSGGTIIFGLEEKSEFAVVGTYDPQDLQQKLSEIGKGMTPVVRPILTVIQQEGRTIVSAEIPPADFVDRPCFKTSAGRLKGSFIRVGGADEPMTEYEVYRYEAYRTRMQDDLRTIPNQTVSQLNSDTLDRYLQLRRMNRPNFAQIPTEQWHTFNEIETTGGLTLWSLLMFGIYPQAYFPQLGIIASRIPGTSIGDVNSEGARFTASRRIEGSLPELLEVALDFLQSNMMRNGIRVQDDGTRVDLPEYPMIALREAVLNALIHRDYGIHAEDKPIQIRMFSDRVEIRSPGGIYGPVSVSDLGRSQPGTRNPRIVRAMEALGYTENRYSGIPTIRRAMAEANLLPPVFSDTRGEFVVCLYNTKQEEMGAASTADGRNMDSTPLQGQAAPDLLAFCQAPRTRQEITAYLGLGTQSYVMKRYVMPLVDSGKLRMEIPQRPRSSKQRFVTNLATGGK